MKVEVRLTPECLADRDRLYDFLAEVSATAAAKALDTLAGGFRDIADHPEIGRPAPNGFRKLVLKFGQGGYEIRYRIDGRHAVVTRILHTLEDRPD